MAMIVNRTQEHGQASDSRRRFLNRVKLSLQYSLKLGKSNKTTGLSHGNVHITSDSLIEPKFLYDYIDNIRPVEAVINNTAFNKGDILLSPPGKDGSGSGASGGTGGDGDGEDEFEFFLDKDEFAALVFEGLKLPNFIEKDKQTIDEKKWKHAGLSKEGMPANVNIIKTYTKAMARRLAIKGDINEEIKKLQEKEQTEEIKLKIEELEKRLLTVPYFDDVDLRYNTRVPVLHKIASAVVFLLLDVSGSMSESMKDRAKRFFYMFNLFLKTQYKNTEVVFITHTDLPLEVSELEFFTSRRSGGTEFLPAYKLVNSIIADRYPVSQYNIYLAHASDSDAFDDYSAFRKYFRENIYNKLQYGAYVHMPVLASYKNTAPESLFGANLTHFKLGELANAADPYMLMRHLFSEKHSEFI
jgi:uncharacterized sporulation protein YeaH/YhbH (DUF444 family)